MSNIEMAYWLEEWPKVRKDIIEWKQKEPDAKVYREIYLSDRFLEEHKHLVRMRELYDDADDEWNRTFIFSCISKSRTELERLKKKIDGINVVSKNDDITDEMIEQARNYPLENIIQIHKGMALCVNHIERTPSMNCRNNWVYCHSCGYHGDVIDVYMKVTGKNFSLAIKDLQ